MLQRQRQNHPSAISHPRWKQGIGRALLKELVRKAIEDGFDAENVEASESLFSIGNGSMGQRANFEEDYSGKTFQGSYIGGIYYPDKTRVGWWKNGYPEYFAKVLNAPNWIGIHIQVNETSFDLNTCKISNFKRELNMQEGWLSRSFNAILRTGEEIEVTPTINGTYYTCHPSYENGYVTPNPDTIFVSKKLNIEA